MIPTGTAIYAVRPGVVTSVSNFAHNCADAAGCGSCGIGATITDSQFGEQRWTYCHLSGRYVEKGMTGVSSRQVGFSHGSAPTR